MVAQSSVFVDSNVDHIQHDQARFGCINCSSMGSAGSHLWIATAISLFFRYDSKFFRSSLVQAMSCLKK